MRTNFLNREDFDLGGVGMQDSSPLWNQIRIEQNPLIAQINPTGVFMQGEDSLTEKKFVLIFLATHYSLVGAIQDK